MPLRPAGGEFYRHVDTRQVPSPRPHDLDGRPPRRRGASTLLVGHRIGRRAATQPIRRPAVELARSDTGGRSRPAAAVIGHGVAARRPTCVIAAIDSRVRASQWPPRRERASKRSPRTPVRRRWPGVVPSRRLPTLRLRWQLPRVVSLRCPASGFPHTPLGAQSGCRPQGRIPPLAARSTRSESPTGDPRRRTPTMTHQVRKPSL